ncbi:hypothetical protein ACLK2F_15760 [Escherichia coli]
MMESKSHLPASGYCCDITERFLFENESMSSFQQASFPISGLEAELAGFALLKT